MALCTNCHCRVLPRTAIRHKEAVNLGEPVHCFGVDKSHGSAYDLNNDYWFLSDGAQATSFNRYISDSELFMF
jgi:hypothetical protein